MYILLVFFGIVGWELQVYVMNILGLGGVFFNGLNNLEFFERDSINVYR